MPTGRNCKFINSLTRSTCTRSISSFESKRKKSKLPFISITSHLKSLKFMYWKMIARVKNPSALLWKFIKIKTHKQKWRKMERKARRSSWRLETWNTFQEYSKTLEILGLFLFRLNVLGLFRACTWDKIFQQKIMIFDYEFT